MWSIYPAHLLKTVGFKLFVEDSFEGNEYLKRGNEGWLYEVLSEKTKFTSHVISQKGKLDTANNVISIIDGKEFSLDKWVIWTKRKFEQNPFDPRVSEWTALSIIHHILNLIEDKKLTQSNFQYQLHPANILVPIQWTKLKGADLTWRSGGKTLQESQKI